MHMMRASVAYRRSSNRFAGVCVCAPRFQAGFTLIEIIVVLVLLGILAVAAVSRMGNLTDDAGKQRLYSLVAAAQSQLSLEFSRRALTGENLEVAAQVTCDAVAISSPDAASNIACVGNLSNSVSITATLAGQSLSGTWASPAASGS